MILIQLKAAAVTAMKKWTIRQLNLHLASIIHVRTLRLKKVHALSRRVIWVDF